MIPMILMILMILVILIIEALVEVTVTAIIITVTIIIVMPGELRATPRRGQGVGARLEVGQRAVGQRLDPHAQRAHHAHDPSTCQRGLPKQLAAKKSSRRSRQSRRQKYPFQWRGKWCRHAPTATWPAR